MATPEQLMHIGQQLVNFNNNNEGRKAVTELYAADCVSAEAVPMPGQTSNEVQGIDDILGKHDWWESANEVHASSAKGPFAHGDDRFCVIYDMDVTEKASGQRIQMKEVATYYVNTDNKICREEFAYALG